MTSKYHWPIATILLLTLYLSAPAHAQDILPFPPAPSASQAGVTIESSTYKKQVEPKRLPADAPNILIILIDDVGAGTPSTYGGEIQTPTLDRIAGLGVSYNRFHSTAMCSPTRAALLTGRNHTRVGNGQIAAIANDFDGFIRLLHRHRITLMGTFVFGLDEDKQDVFEETARFVIDTNIDLPRFAVSQRYARRVTRRDGDVQLLITLEQPGACH